MYIKNHMTQLCQIVCAYQPMWPRFSPLANTIVGYWVLRTRGLRRSLLSTIALLLLVAVLWLLLSPLCLNPGVVH